LSAPRPAGREKAGAMKSSSPQRVAVIGGGIFGVSTAVHLVRGGAEASLVTEGAFADGASGRSLSWLNSARLRSAHYHQLRMIGIDRYRTLAAGRPDAAWLRFNGGLTWDADDQSNAIASVFVHERNIGYDARLLDAKQVAAVTPGVNTRAITPQGAILNPGEGWVDLPALIGVLLEEFVALGGRAAAGKGPATVETRNGRATGVALGDGERIAADAIVLAVGAAAPKTLAQFGARIPDSTPISLLLRTEPLRHPLRAVLNTPRVAIRPEPGGGFVLDSAWSEEEVRIRDDGTYAVQNDTLRRLLAEASGVLEGNPKLTLAGYGVGPKPIPGDGDPVLGELDKTPGLNVAFSHSGATLGLIAGELLADTILAGRPHPLLLPFRPGRFNV
jgi:glycine/D-amino acid oxidase-like deaminating enzyme